MKISYQHAYGLTIVTYYWHFQMHIPQWRTLLKTLLYKGHFHIFLSIFPAQAKSWWKLSGNSNILLKFPSTFPEFSSKIFPKCYVFQGKIKVFPIFSRSLENLSMICYYSNILLTGSQKTQEIGKHREYGLYIVTFRWEISQNSWKCWREFQ